jgi:heavy metal efflux system protein
VTIGDVADVSCLSHTPRGPWATTSSRSGRGRGLPAPRREPGTRARGCARRSRSSTTASCPKGCGSSVSTTAALVGLTLKTVHHNLLHGALLVVGLVWLFLRSVRGALIVGVVIPLSLLSAFIGLYP